MVEERIEKLLDSIIRVNYAGEFGAKHIYKSQIKMLKDENHKIKMQQMLSQEIEHLEYFESLGKKFQIRPTIMNPIWKISASAMGIITGKLGMSAVMAATSGVENVICKHYQEQIEEIDDILEKIGKNHKYSEFLENLKHKIIQIMQDEKEHEQEGYNYNQKPSFLDKLVFRTSAFCSKIAIEVSKKI